MRCLAFCVSCPVGVVLLYIYISLLHSPSVDLKSQVPIQVFPILHFQWQTMRNRTWVKNTRQLVRMSRRLDRRLLPGVSMLYLLSFLDRSNVANARLDGLTKDLHITGDQYLTGLTVFFLGYISLEVVWNLILKRVGPRIWLPSITLAWGIVTTLQGIVVNKEEFYVVRTFLGLTEGGLFPGK